jgi:uncharacterized repeat protein (TIGR02543 family)
MSKKLSLLLTLPLLILGVLFFSSTTQAACLSLNSNMALGSLNAHFTTPDVTSLQNFLQSQGLLTATPNGVFGLATQQAVKTFQTNQGLESTGYVGALTRAKINSLSCGLNTASGVTVPASPIAVANSPVLAPAPAPMSITDFINLLITIGVIPPDKVPAVQAFINAQGATPATTPRISSGGGGGGGGGSSSSATYRVTYNGNGKTGGAVPSDATKYRKNATVTVLDNTGSLVKTGYAFNGWNTKANGSGTSYIADETFTITASVTLYAEWNPVIEIYNWTDLNNIRNNLSASYILMNDISSTTSDYPGIGDNWVPLDLSGTFDGNGGIISDLRSNSNGLFSSVSGDIYDIGLSNINISGTVGAYGISSIGGLVGGLVGTVSNSYATGVISGTGLNVGGLIGNVERSATVSDSYFIGDVISSSNRVGGLIGWLRGGSVYRSYSSGSVSGGTQVGGLVGQAFETCCQTPGIITDSYSLSNVTGSGSVGGLIGQVQAGTVSNNYAFGNVSAGSTSGGLIGLKTVYPTISNSYWDIETSGQASSAGGIGTTTEAMKTWPTYTDWDIVPTGVDLNNGYPYLSWQIGNNSPTWLIYIPTYTVTYDGNGNDSGTVPVDSTNYSASTPVTIQNIGTLNKTGYIFTGWNTAADGSGFDYAASSTATIFVYEDNVTLYAQWVYDYNPLISYVDSNSVKVDEVGAIRDYTLIFDVEATDENVNISRILSEITGDDASNSSDDVVFTVVTPGSATASSSASLSSTASRDGEIYTVYAGQTKRFTLTVTVSGVSATGQYKVVLDEVAGSPATDIETASATVIAE